MKSIMAIIPLMGYLVAVTIEPQNPVVRLGQTARLMCKVGGPVNSCLWEINGELHNLQKGAKYQPFGVLKDGECGIQATITEAENGEWTCRVFVQGVVDRAEKATTNIKVIALPQIKLLPNADPITVMAGETLEIKCVLTNALPIPAIHWMIGNREIGLSNRRLAGVLNNDGTTTITDTLRYAFQADDHGQVLRCLTNGPWLNTDDQHDAFALLNIIGKEKISGRAFSSNLRQQMCHSETLQMSCNPLIDVNPVPIICSEDNSIPIPNSTRSCNSSDRKWMTSSCYRSQNIANKMHNPNVRINLEAFNLLDGNLNTFAEITNRTHLPLRWDIYLGQQYSVYAVFVIFFSTEDNVAVDVHTRFSNAQTNNFSEMPCNRASSSPSRSQKYVFYCTSNNSSKITSGIPTQNVVVSVTNRLVRVAEIEVYENLGLECGSPSRSLGTVYTPVRSHYSVGDSIEYKCQNISNTILFGSNTRRCGSDGKWAGFAPLCHKAFPLEKKEFDVDSSIDILHDGNISSCREIEFLGLVNTSSESVSYDVRLHDRAIIGLITIEFQNASGGDCHIEIPTHPNIGFVRSNRWEDFKKSIGTLQYIPRIKDNRFTCQSDEGNPAHLIQSFKDQHQVTPTLRITCPIHTILCEIRVLQVEDLPNTCGDPEIPTNANHEPVTDNIVNYSCQPGFSLSTKIGRRSCTNRRQWDPPPTCDRITCRNYPPIISNHEWSLLNNSITSGSIAHYFKDDDSDSSPEIIMQCNDFGTWIDVTPKQSFPDTGMITIASASAGLFILLVAGFYILFRRLRLRSIRRKSSVKTRSQRTTESRTQSNYSVRFLKTGQGRPPSGALLSENLERPDSTVYEEIENLYDYDDILKSPVKNGPTNQDFHRQNESPISPFPRPPLTHFTFPPIVPSIPAAKNTSPSVVPIQVDTLRKSKSPMSTRKIPKL